MDVRLKNGNKNKIKLSLELGLISTKIFAEGPLNKGKTTYMISLRRCNFDLLTRGYFNVTNKDYVAGYTFYDGYGKITHTINLKSNISFSFYNGRDKIFNNNTSPTSWDPDFYYYKSKMKNTWGNSIVSAKYNLQISRKLYSSSTVGYTIFYYKNSLENSLYQVYGNKFVDRDTKFYNSGINDILFKQDFDYYASDKLIIKAGLSFTGHKFNLGVYQTNLLHGDNSAEKNILRSQEIDLYEQNEIKLKHHISMNLGIHLNGYFYDGVSYYSIQPRVNLNKSFNETNALKFSFSSMSQNMHVLTNNGVGVL